MRQLWAIRDYTLIMDFIGSFELSAALGLYRVALAFKPARHIHSMIERNIDRLDHRDVALVDLVHWHQRRVLWSQILQDSHMITWPVPLLLRCKKVLLLYVLVCRRVN